MIINGIILSAGYSSRMDDFKPLALYKKKSFLENIILKLNIVCEQITIVTGFKAEELKDKIIKKFTNAGNTSVLKKIIFAENINFDKGMFGSIQTGISKCADSGWAIIHQVDQPGLQNKFYGDFINEIDDKHNWIQPSYKNKLGHPILIYKTLYGLITNESIESNLRVVSKEKKIKKKIWDCNYKEILQDIDTNEDYKKLIKNINKKKL